MSTGVSGAKRSGDGVLLGEWGVVFRHQLDHAARGAVVRRGLVECCDGAVAEHLAMAFGRDIAGCFVRIDDVALIVTEDDRQTSIHDPDAADRVRELRELVAESGREPSLWWRSFMLDEQHPDDDGQGGDEQHPDDDDGQGGDDGDANPTEQPAARPGWYDGLGAEPAPAVLLEEEPPAVEPAVLLEEEPPAVEGPPAPKKRTSRKS